MTDGRQQRELERIQELNDRQRQRRLEEIVLAARIVSCELDNLVPSTVTEVVDFRMKSGKY
ncbi:hypothetical protein BH10PLA2_BH10PLA2_27790 [soil metagenome]